MQIGDRIGDYEVVEVIGAGGMGQVYKVRNTLSERLEAMKVLLPNLEADPALADRFLREIKTQAALDHPNITKLHTAMRSGNQLLMMMEFVEGTPVDKLLRAGALTPSAAVNYAVQVLDALAYAHSHDVVHRDIKPANIMITPSGVAKLMDFGIARMREDRSLTKTGGTVGSLYYMSPEQIRGSNVDGRADLYSLGVTLFEMVTGRRPFAGDSDFQVMSAHLMQSPPAPIEIIPGVPSDLNDIILMSLAKDPDQRFQSAQAFRGALISLGMQSLGAQPQQTMAPVPPMPFETVAPPPLTEAAPFTVTGSAMAPPPIPNGPPTLPHTLANRTAPPQMPPIAPVRPAGRRGLYMAMGSVVTVAILVLAAIYVPGMINTKASVPQTQATTDSTITTSNSGGSQNPAPAVVTNTPPVAENAAPPAPDNSAANSAAVTPNPFTPRTPDRSPVVPPKSARPADTTPVEMAQNSPSGQFFPPPMQQAQNAAQVQQQAPPQAAAPAPPPPPSPEIRELRERFNNLSARATAARDQANEMEQRLAAQGLGMRGDVRAARIRMDFLLQEAAESIKRGNVEQARQNLQYVEGSIAVIQRTLGQ